MIATPTALAERLDEEGQKTRQFFNQLAPDQWERIVYTEGAGWSIRQVLAHFVSSEAAMTRLVTNILAGGPGSPENFNLNEYNERKVASLDALSPAELLERFVELRHESSNVVRKMTPGDLAKTGRHPFLGIASLEEILKLFYVHNQIHIRDVRRGLK